MANGDNSNWWNEFQSEVRREIEQKNEVAKANYANLERKFDEQIAQMQARHQEAVVALQQVQDQPVAEHREALQEAGHREEKREAEIATL